VSKSKTVVIEAGTLLTPTRKFSRARVLVEGGSIAAVGIAEEIRIPAGADTVDASQFIVTPGFIDPHIHGCGGVDVMDGSYETLNAVSRIVARHGTTAFLPTTVSSPVEILNDAVEKLGKVISKTFDGATPLGIHLEGPFISPAKRGTHKAANVAAPDAKLLQTWIHSSEESIRLMTVAPELDGIDAVLGLARDAGITVAMGHSNANFEQANAAAASGVSYAVHTFNAMREFTHREPGIVGAVLANDAIFAEIIADGIHVNPSVVRVFARAKGKMRVLLVTDAISATDMPDGCFVLGSDKVNVVNGVCRDAEGRLAGSTLSQEIAFRNFVEWSGWTLEDALLGLTLNPAKALNLDKKGVLEPGADADIAIIDNNFRVMKTFVRGKLVFDRG
jgi:N-acetylglucosamine-6-phosphate deacetylase